MLNLNLKIMENSNAINESVKNLVGNGWNETQVNNLLNCLVDYSPKEISNDLTNLFHFFAFANAEGEQSFQSSFTGSQYKSFLLFLHQVNLSLNS